MAKKNSKLYRLTLNDDTSHKRIRLWRFSKAGIIIGVISAAVILFGILLSHSLHSESQYSAIRMPISSREP